MELPSECEVCRTTYGRCCRHSPSPATETNERANRARVVEARRVESVRGGPPGAPETGGGRKGPELFVHGPVMERGSRALPKAAKGCVSAREGAAALLLVE